MPSALAHAGEHQGPHRKSHAVGGNAGLMARLEAQHNVQLEEHGAEIRNLRAELETLRAQPQPQQLQPQQTQQPQPQIQPQPQPQLQIQSQPQPQLQIQSQPQPQPQPQLQIQPQQVPQPMPAASGNAFRFFQGACRTASDAAGSYATERVELTRCRELCAMDPTCGAFEVKDNKAACEIHIEPIVKATGVAGTSCYVKEGWKRPHRKSADTFYRHEKVDAGELQEHLAATMSGFYGRNNLTQVMQKLAVQGALHTDGPRRRFIFTIATLEALPFTINLFRSAHRFNVTVGAVTLLTDECVKLRSVDVVCEPANLLPIRKDEHGNDITADGYALTFAKFQLCRIAIELGWVPTFLDSDLVVNAPLLGPSGALAHLSQYGAYIALGLGSTCGKTIDGFMHCGKDCVVGGAFWRVMGGFSMRAARFDNNTYVDTFWAQLDATGATKPPHKRVFFRENLLLNDVLASECCGFDINHLVQPSQPNVVEGRQREVDAFLGRIMSEECQRMTIDAEGALWRETPAGGTVALAPPSIVGNFQASFRAPMATTSSERLALSSIILPGLGVKPLSNFAHSPPAMAHFVGATPYKIEYMQAYNMWDFRVDTDAQRLGLLGRGKKSETKGCNVQKLDCVGQLQFNGLEVRRQTYFAQLPNTRLMSSERGQRYLLLDMQAWPAEFPQLARLWLAADRLAQLLDRELVPWNLPDSFVWSHEMTPREQPLGVKAAVVEASCRIILGQGASGRRVLGRSMDSERCGSNIFFDLVDQQCGGLAEQLYACTAHVHRTRFERAVADAPADLASAALDLATVSGPDAPTANARRILHFKASNDAAVHSELARVEAAAGASRNQYRTYRITESRRCPVSEICQAPIIAG